MQKLLIRFEITGRGLVVRDQALLLVSHGEYWYTPGGRAEPGESLPECVKREVWEETGLKVEVQSLLYVGEFFEASRGRHKVEFYFLAAPRSGELPEDWRDVGGQVSKRRFFTLAELSSGIDCQPRFLAQGNWLEVSPRAETYIGYEKR